MLFLPLSLPFACKVFLWSMRHISFYTLMWNPTFCSKNSNIKFLTKSNFTHFLPIFMGLKILLEKKVTPKSGFVVFNIHLLVDKRDIWPMHKSLLQKNWADDQPSRFPSKNQLTHSFNHHLE